MLEKKKIARKKKKKKKKGTRKSNGTFLFKAKTDCRSPNIASADCYLAFNQNAN